MGEPQHVHLLHRAGVGTGRPVRGLLAPCPHAHVGQHVPERDQSHPVHEATIPVPGK